MELAPRARARKQDATWENAVLKTEILHRKDKAVWEPEGVKAVDQAKAPAGVRAEGEAPDRVAVGSLNILTNQQDTDLHRSPQILITLGFFYRSQKDIRLSV